VYSTRKFLTLFLFFKEAANGCNLTVLHLPGSLNKRGCQELNNFAEHIKYFSGKLQNEEKSQNFQKSSCRTL